MSVKTSSAKPPQARRKAAHKRSIWITLFAGFAVGTGAALFLCAGAAALFARTALSLELVKPAACGAAAVGAFLSGLVLADGIRQKKLLCGLAAGVFYALCALAATALFGEALSVESPLNLALLGALVFGGTAGGVFSAVIGVPARTPQR